MEKLVIQSQILRVRLRIFDPLGTNFKRPMSDKTERKEEREYVNQI